MSRTTQTTTHRHRPIDSLHRVEGYTGPVARPENRLAHGGVCIIDECECGATRRTNSTGGRGRRERGPWIAPRREEAR